MGAFGGSDIPRTEKSKISACFFAEGLQKPKCNGVEYAQGYLQEMISYLAVYLYLVGYLI